ncbi:MAG: M13 family metallopeptidase [Betaproteobacteria bacterium]
MIKVSFRNIVIALAVIAIPQTANADEATPRFTNTLEAVVDAGIRPGDDFFAYANGAWLKSTQIPAGKSRWTAAGEIGELARKQIAQLLDDAASAPAGSTARKVADYRAAWMNEAAIEAKGLAPIKPMLNSINRVHDKAGLTQLLGSGPRADVDPMNQGVFDSSHVLGLATQVSIHGEKNYVAFLVEGGLSLPDRQHYLGTETRMQQARTRYRNAIASLLAILCAGNDAGGANSQTDCATSVSNRADAVLSLETAIAQSHATPEVSGNEKNADNVWTRADFARLAPGMDWSAFFAAAGLAKQQTFVAWQPDAVKGLAALVASQPLTAWKDYLRVHVVTDYVDILPRDLAELAPALRGDAVDPPTMPRIQRATAATESAMSEAIGKLYAERHFPLAYKTQVKKIAADVVTAFTKRVETAPWFSAPSKAIALEKMKTLYFGVGYPEKWENDSGLVINATDAVGNRQRIAARNYRRTLARLGKPADRTEWTAPPQWVGAVLLFQQNSYNFSAALMQSPKFDPAAPDARNYGAIGAIFGHEISHFVDTLGADYEANGNARRWWTAEETTRFEAASTALVNQFSRYRPFADAAIDGKLTLTENIADLAGLSAAFDAHREHLRATAGSKAADKDYVRQQDREFFIGYGGGWRSKYREDGLRKQIANDHAPETYRIATVRNLDAWYDAFDVQPGQLLYLAPAERVRVW